MGTNGTGVGASVDAAELRASWDERVAADARFDERARELLAREVATLEAVGAAVVARIEGDDDDGRVERGARAAHATGRVAFSHDIDLPALQRLFGHLHDVVIERFLHGATDADGCLCPREAGSRVRRVRRAMERPVVEATRGWFEEAGRKLRHDVKTPLQATSLNLELLTMESAERGLDTEALDTIQRSLDQVVELLARSEPADG